MRKRKRKRKRSVAVAVTMSICNCLRVFGWLGVQNGYVPTGGCHSTAQVKAQRSPTFSTFFHLHSGKPCGEGGATGTCSTIRWSQQGWRSRMP